MTGELVSVALFVLIMTSTVRCGSCFGGSWDSSNSLEITARSMGLEPMPVDQRTVSLVHVRGPFTREYRLEPLRFEEATFRMKRSLNVSRNFWLVEQ